MKQILTAILLMSFSAAASATPNLKHIEICDLNNEENSFEVFNSIDLKTAKSLTNMQLALLNQHLMRNEYASEPLSLKQIQALFSKGGDYQFDDLEIYQMRSSKTGDVYIATKSYPGDNPYGLYFDARGKLVGSNGDDTIYIVTPKGEVYCGDL